MGFTDFTFICTAAALPFCPLLGTKSNLSASAGIQPACYSRTIEIANTTIFQGAASFIHIAALIMATIMVLHVRSKFTAVGRKEITTFFYLYMLVEVFSLVLDAGVVPPSSSALPYFAAGQIGLASATCMALFINGLVGFQVYEDGTALSVWLLRGASLIWGAIEFLVALLTFEGWAGLGASNTTGLFVLMYIFNGLLLAIYVGMQILLVVGTLQERWPLGDIAFGVLFFVVGQVLLYATGAELCERVEHYFDGLFIASVTNLLAVMMIYKYWDSITTEDLEFSVGTKTGAWDVRDKAPPSLVSASAGPSARASVYEDLDYRSPGGYGMEKRRKSSVEMLGRYGADRKTGGYSDFPSPVQGMADARKSAQVSVSPYGNGGHASSSQTLLQLQPPGKRRASRGDGELF